VLDESAGHAVAVVARLHSGAGVQGILRADGDSVLLA